MTITPQREPYSSVIQAFSEYPSEAVNTETITSIIGKLNEYHSEFNSESNKQDLAQYLNFQGRFKAWNTFHPDLNQIEFKRWIPETNIVFDRVEFGYETKELKPLVIRPKEGEISSFTDFKEWTQTAQRTLSSLIKEHGAVVFSNFGITQDTFSEAYQAVTGMSPAPYPGAFCPCEYGVSIYPSTEAPSRFHPLHQELSSGLHEKMPKMLAFFCAAPPDDPSTGITTLGDPKALTESLKAEGLWKHFKGKTLNYTARFLPDDTWVASWIQFWNPSHRTVIGRFGTDKHQKIEDACKRAGAECVWDNGWAIVTHKDIPATTIMDGQEVFCNQIPSSRASEALCGGEFNYFMFNWFLYPKESMRQFDVTYSDGTPIPEGLNDRVIALMKKNQITRPWNAGDLLVLPNVRTMHGTTPHEGQGIILKAMS